MTPPNVQFFPTVQGDIAQVSFGVAAVMPFAEAVKLASGLECLIAQQARRVRDERAAGNDRWADNIQVGVDCYIAQLARLTAAMAEAKTHPIQWVKPLHTAAPHLFKGAA